MHMIFRNKIRELENSLRFRTLYGRILRIMFSEKVHKDLCTFIKKITMHALSEMMLLGRELMIENDI